MHVARYRFRGEMDVRSNTYGRAEIETAVHTSTRFGLGWWKRIACTRLFDPGPFIAASPAGEAPGGLWLVGAGWEMFRRIGKALDDVSNDTTAGLGRQAVPRRLAMAGALAMSIMLTLAGCMTASVGAAGNGVSYRGYRFDTSGVPRDVQESILDAARRQVDIVEAVPLSAETKHFFQGFTIHLARGAGGGGHFGRRGVSIDLKPGPDDRPILLHEFMHAFQDDRLPGGTRNPDVLRFYQHARTAGLWPPRSYMLKNVSEYFAMCASTYLYGHADRPPLSRDDLAAKQPQFADWLGRNVL